MNTEDILLGAIAGDIIGSVYEFSPVKSGISRCLLKHRNLPMTP